jgi:mRNA interferase MazF
MRRGDVFVAHLSPRSGSEQKGRRPVVVVSHDGFNETPGWRSVLVVPFSTSHSQAVRGPTAIPVGKGEAGLGRDCCALCHQVTTLSREKLARRIGSLPETTVKRIDEGLKAALDLD